MPSASWSALGLSRQQSRRQFCCFLCSAKRFIDFKVWGHENSYKGKRWQQFLPIGRQTGQWEGKGIVSTWNIFRLQACSKTKMHTVCFLDGPALILGDYDAKTGGGR